MPAAWVVVPALEALRLELNTVAPNRDKRSDGGVGDTSHGARPSGHNPDESGSPEDFDADDINEVRSRDFDKDLNRPGLTMEMVCQYLLRECRAGRIRWIKYLIFNRRIWSASTGWSQRIYVGANPHDHHLHVSCKPDTASENTTRLVGLASILPEELPVNQTDFDKLMTGWAKSASGQAALASAVFNTDGVVAAPGRPKPGLNADKTPVNTHWAALSYLMEIWTKASRLQTAVTEQGRVLTAVATREPIDVVALTAAIASSVLAGLPAGSDPVTKDELTESLRELFAAVGKA